MKFCLIELPGVDKGWMNIGLGYLASSLMKKGHFVKVIDLNNNEIDIEKRLKECSEYDAVGISIKSFAIRNAIKLSRMIKNDLKCKYVMCGGPHISVDGYNFLLQNENFDVGVVGEGEETIVEIAEAIENNKGFHDIKGIIYRDKDKVVVNPVRGLNVDLDLLPYPNYEVFDSYKGTITQYPLVTSRGCPYSCIFCGAGVISGKKWRARSPLSVIEELATAKSKYHPKMFSILDDNFTFDKNRAKEICRLLIEHKINMKWMCSNGIRADRIDEELATLMKESGCSHVGVGIESIDPEIFPTIKKGESLDDIKQGIEILKKSKIRVSGYFIIGFPGDNLERTKSSIELAKKLGLFSMSWALLSPYPKTEVWEWIKQNGRILKNWEDVVHSHQQKGDIVFETDDFSLQERIDAYRIVHVKLKYYYNVIDNEKSLIQNVFNIMKIIIRYDTKNILLHSVYILAYVVRNIKFVRRFYRKRSTRNPLRGG